MIRFETRQPLTRENTVLSQFLDCFFDTAVIVDTNLNVLNFGASSTQLFSDHLPDLIGEPISRVDKSTPFEQVAKTEKEILYRKCTLNGQMAIQSLYPIYVQDTFQGILAISNYVDLDLLVSQLFNKNLYTVSEKPDEFTRHSRHRNPLILSQEELQNGNDTLDALVNAIFDSAVYLTDTLKIVRSGFGKLRLSEQQKQEMLDAPSIKSFDDTAPYDYVLKSGKPINNMLSLVLGRQCFNDICPIYDKHRKIIGIVGGIRFSCLDTIREQFRDAEIMDESISARLQKGYTFDDFIGSCPATQNLITICKKYANADYPVLIMGESGTGKEIIAGAMHSVKLKQDFKPYVKINCTAIPNDLLESELFGHEKGAFTGATSVRKGKFEIANGGTILLDEIGDMSLSLQSKLLRVLEEKVFERIGGSKEIPLNARIIASTNCDLYQNCQDGSFRLDLYYRLNTLEIKIPSLRERKSDIPQLISHFLIKNGAVVGIRPSAMDAFMEYDWPGNVRELRNVINRICILHDNESISAEQVYPYLYGNKLPPKNITAVNSGNVSAIDCCTLEEAEVRLIRTTLAHYKYNINRSSESLGISRATLYNKMKRYQIPREQGLNEI